MATTTTSLKEFNAKNGAVIGTTSANYLQLLGGAASNSVSIRAQGTDTNISISLIPKGSGSVNIPSGTNLAIANGTLSGVLYLDSSLAVTSSSNLLFDGTNITTAGTNTALAFIPTGSTVPTNGLFLPSVNSIGLSTNTTQRVNIDASGNVSIGISSTTSQLHVVSATPSTKTALTIKSNLTYVSPDGSKTITTRMLDSGTLTFNGSAGQLFSISDVLTGTIFAVNDISGVPSIEVYDTGKIQLAELFGNVLIGTATDNGTDKLQVNGSASIGALTVTGNLTVNGSTTTINSSIVTIDDPIFLLGGDTAPTADDNKDRGISFRWHTGSAAKVGFFGFDDSTGYLTFIPDATNTAEVFSGDMGDIQATNFRGALIGNADTATKWTTTRTITLSGDVTSSAVNIDGSGNVTIATTIAADSVALGTDTTGNYVSALTAGTGITLTGVAGEGTNYTIAHTDTSTQATVTNTGNTFIQSITLDDFGHITAISSAGSVGFLTAEADTLGTVTGRGATTSTASTFSGGFTLSSTTANIAIGTSITTGVVTIGGTASTSDLTLGQSTVSQTVNIATGATASGSTKTVSIGTTGVSGSSTVFNIGSVVSGALSTINISGQIYKDTAGNVGIGIAIPTYKLHVVGSFAATTKSFLIDHPTKPEMKLRYGSLESPYHGVRLTGEGKLINGICTIALPDYIHGLCHQEGSQVQITNIKHGKVIWIEEINVNNDEFTVAADVAVHDEKEYGFYWSFTAIRKDIEPMLVEIENDKL